MHTRIKGALAATAAASLIFGLAACDDSDADDTAIGKQVNAQIDARGGGYVPKNNVEFDNYNKAQKLYDDPNTIIFCTATFPNDSAPIFTVPIKGKLTSSSVSLRPNQQVKLDTDTGGMTYYPEIVSVDGMYHGNPPAYRFGFTPGGQYVDFSGLQVFCTTQPTKFQRETTQVSTADAGLVNAQSAAEDALKKGDPKKAQDILDGAVAK